jgi:hypothetical protein
MTESRDDLLALRKGRCEDGAVVPCPTLHPLQVKVFDFDSSEESHGTVRLMERGAKRTWNGSAHIRPTKHKIGAAPFLLPNAERRHSVLKN